MVTQLWLSFILFRDETYKRMDTNSVGEYANGLEVDTVENTLQTTNFGKYLSYFKLHSKYRYFYGI